MPSLNFGLDKDNKVFDSPMALLSIYIGVDLLEYSKTILHSKQMILRIRPFDRFILRNRW